MSVHTVVIGAGAIGLATAAALVTKPNHKVTVIDRKHPGAGSSSLSAGVFTRQYVDEEDIALRVRSVQLLESLEQQANLTLRRIGFLRLARDAEQLDCFAESVRVQHRLACPEARVLDPSELTELMPGLVVDGVVGGLFNPMDGYLDGAELCTSLAGTFRDAGGTLMSNATVLEVTRRGSRFELRLRGDQVITADVVINAAGAWAQQVGDMLGAPVQIVNERHEAYVLQLPRSYSGPTIPMTLDYCVGDDSAGVYFRHEGHDQLVAGLHSNDPVGDIVADPDEYDAKPSDTGAEQVLGKLAELLPGIEVGYRSGWAGLYPHAPGRPLLVGPHPDADGVFVAGGGGGLGLHMAPVVGEIVAEWVADGHPKTFDVAEKWAPTAATSVGKL